MFILSLILTLFMQHQPNPPITNRCLGLVPQMNQMGAFDVPTSTTCIGGGPIPTACFTGCNNTFHGRAESAFVLHCSAVETAENKLISDLRSCRTGRDLCLAAWEGNEHMQTGCYITYASCVTYAYNLYQSTVNAANNEFDNSMSAAGEEFYTCINPCCH